MLVDFIVDRVIEMYRDYEKFRAWIMSLGDILDIRVTRGIDNYEYIALRNKFSNITVTVSRRYDPVTNTTLLLLLFYGPWFIYLPGIENAFKRIKQFYRELRRKETSFEKQ